MATRIVDLDRGQSQSTRQLRFILTTKEENPRVEALQMNYLINVLHRKKWIRQIIKAPIQNEMKGECEH